MIYNNYSGDVQGALLPLQGRALVMVMMMLVMIMLCWAEHDEE